MTGMPHGYRDTTCPQPGQISLYRFYDADEGLLYVGFSNEPWRRRKEHSVTQPWYPRVRHQSITWYDSEDAARRAETIAIRTERPQFNIAGAIKAIEPPAAILEGVPEPDPVPRSAPIFRAARRYMPLAWVAISLTCTLTTGMMLLPRFQAFFVGCIDAVLIAAPVLSLIWLVGRAAPWVLRLGLWLDRCTAEPAAGGSS